MEQIQSRKTSATILFLNIINPNYTKIENDIINNKQTINSIENSIRIHQGYIDELTNLVIR